MEMSTPRKYGEPEIETAPIEKLREMQLGSLKALMEKAYEKTAFYRRKFAEVGIEPKDIKSLDDIAKLPLTRHLEDFVATPLADKMAVPWKDVSVIWNSSGTVTGTPQLVPIARNEYERYVSLIARFLYLAEISEDDVIMLLVPNDMWIVGIQRLGARLLPGVGAGALPHNQIQLIDKAGVTAMLALPSLFLQVAELGKQYGIDLRKTKLQKVLFVGEPWTESLRRKMEGEWGVKFYDVYGSSELPGRGGECMERNGIHVFTDFSLLEIVDPETGEVLPPGEEGEIVITNLGSEAIPLIRYQTGDVAAMLPYEICPCGRTHPRISRIKGRVAHIIRVKGVKLLPYDIEELIGKNPRLTGEYQVIVDRPGERDTLKVKIEHTEGVTNQQALKEEVEKAFAEELSVKAEVELLPPGGIPKTMWKAQRIISA